MLTAVVAFCVIAFLWFYIKLRNSHLGKHGRKFPSPPGLPFLGNIFRFMSDSKGNFEKVQSFCNKYPRFFAAWVVGRLFVIIYKPQDIEKVLSSNTLLDKSSDYRFILPWVGYGLLTSTGQRWRTHRKILTPAFHFKILEQFVEIFNRNGEILSEKLKRHVGGAPFNVYKYVNLAALDNICESAMGVNMNIQKNKSSKYLQAVKDACMVSNSRMFKKWLQVEWVFKLTKYYEIEKKALKVLHETTENVIRKRKEEQKQSGEKVFAEGDEDIGQKKKLAFLDLLLESCDGEILSDQDIREEVDTFMFEGHDTITSGIGFLLYALAQYPTVQEKVYAEQTEIFGDSDRLPTFRDLNEMKYLEQTIKETQRLYPSVPIIARSVTEDIVLDETYTIPKGSQVNMVLYMLHRDPESFPEPDVFNPDNFLPDAIQKRNPFAFVPFSAGPRNCIGQRFAMLEMKSTVSKLVRKYRFLPSPYPKDRIQLSLELVLISTNGVHVKIVNRI